MRTENPIQGLTPELEELLTSGNIKETLCGNLVSLAEEVLKRITTKVRILTFRQVFKYIQRLFLTNDLFDKMRSFLSEKATIQLHESRDLQRIST